MPDAIPLGLGWRLIYISGPGFAAASTKTARTCTSQTSGGPWTGLECPLATRRRREMSCRKPCPRLKGKFLQKASTKAGHVTQRWRHYVRARGGGYARGGGKLYTPLDAREGVSLCVVIMARPQAIWRKFGFLGRSFITCAEVNNPPTSATFLIGCACLHASGGRMSASATRRNSQACASTLVDST